ncbi:unnamed protein product [Boreogadus saida]
MWSEDSQCINDPSALLPLLDEQQCDSVDALGTDLREAVLSELVLVKSEALHAMGDLTKWTQPRQVERTLAAALVVSEPQGVVLTMGAGGRPVEQALGPLVGAIAAGNGAVVIPYERTSRAGELLHRPAPSYHHTECYHVLSAGGEYLGPDGGAPI